MAAEKTSKELDGRVAIVTGAGQGIGRGVALGLAHEGATVIVDDILSDLASNVANEIRALGGKAIVDHANVADWMAVETMVKQVVTEFGKVDILINNAGILRATTPLEKITEDEWDEVMGVNVKGAFNCAKAVLPLMKGQHRGKIVNVSSIAGRSASNSGGVHYSCSKAALLGFTRHLAREAAPFGINVNAIAPAGVETEMVSKVWSAEQIAALIERIPLGRLASTDEIANLVVFLSSDRAAYITGATIDINGGLLLI
jgi:3-oxoacyl-[acyl-carrier protein] reductase